MKKILALTLAALLALCMISCDNSKEEGVNIGEDQQENDAVVGDVLVYENFEYEVNEEGDYEITGFVYAGSDKIDIDIPASIDGRPVTGISDDAFKAITSIKSVKIPDSITYIGQYAFFDCDYITEITIPASVTSIGVGAFMECEALKTVKLPASVTEIADYAFMYCEALTDITLPDTLVSIGDGAFWKCDSLTKVTIPASVKSIGDTAFIYCENLAEITVLSKDCEIGQWAFGEYGTTTVLKAAAGSTAQKYAEATEIKFEATK